MKQKQKQCFESNNENQQTFRFASLKKFRFYKRKFVSKGKSFLFPTFASMSKPEPKRDSASSTEDFPLDYCRKRAATVSNLISDFFDFSNKICFWKLERNREYLRKTLSKGKHSWLLSCFCFSSNNEPQCNILVKDRPFERISFAFQRRNNFDKYRSWNVSTIDNENLRSDKFYRCYNELRVWLLRWLLVDA